jgi:hypothetical protein
MAPYETPKISELGSLADLTLQNFNKHAGSSDTITIAGVTLPAPGSGEI